MKIVLNAKEKGIYEKYAVKLIVMSGEDLDLKAPDYAGSQLKGIHNKETADGGLEVTVATGYIEDMFLIAERIVVAIGTISFVVKPLLKELKEKIDKTVYYWLAPDNTAAKEEPVNTDGETKVA